MNFKILYYKVGLEVQQTSLEGNTLLENTTAHSVNTKDVSIKKILRKKMGGMDTLMKNCKQPKGVVSLILSSFGASMGGSDSPPAVKQSSENFHSHLILF